MSVTTEELQDLRKRAAAKRRLEELRTDYGLPFYEPHPKQEMFHRAGEATYRLLESANRFGKSQCGSAEVSAHARGARVWFDKDDPAYSVGINKKPNRILVVCSEWEKVDDIFTGDGKNGGTGKLWDYLPRALTKVVSRNSKGVIDKLSVESLHGGTSLIAFDTGRSFALNPQGSESSNWDFILIDEPPEHAHWIAVSRGLVDHGGRAAFTCTNLDQPWISTFFEAPVKRKEDLVEIYRHGRLHKWTIRGTMRDNPHLTEEAIRMFEETLSDDEKACRIYGIPLHLSGIIYKEYDDQKHVMKGLPEGWTSFSQPPPNWPVLVLADTHPKTPHASLFGAVGPGDIIYVFDERFVHETAEQLIDYYKQRTMRLNTTYWGIEPGAFIPDPSTKRVFANVFHQHGIPFLKATKDLSNGIKLVQQYLRTGKLLFSPTVTRTLWEIEQYSWDIKKGVPTNKPKDKDDHMMENLYRMCTQMPVFALATNYVPPVEPTEINSAPVDFSSDEWGYLEETLRS